MEKLGLEKNIINLLGKKILVQSCSCLPAFKRRNDGTTVTLITWPMLPDPSWQKKIKIHDNKSCNLDAHR